MEMCLVPRLSCRPSSNVPHLPSFLKVLQNPHVWFTAVKVQNPLCLPWKVAFERAKVPQTWGVFGILTSKCACHSRMHFLDAHPTRWLRTPRFSEPTYFFDPPEPQNIGKTQRFATFYLFGAPFSSFYFPLLWLYPLLLLHLSIKSLTSKLPFNRDCVCVFFVGF